MTTNVLLVCYCSVFLVSSTLLFSVQPMVAKMVLPLYGGSSAVWTTCMLFFQATLLAGYGYAHVTTVWLPVRRQILLHVVLVLIPIILLPLAVPDDWTAANNANPAFSLLLLLLIVVGGPLLVVSTTAPLMQRWFAETEHPDAEDPYFLYAISNFGSMVALLGYPILIEPMLRLSQQARWWSCGYVALVVLIGLTAVLTFRMGKKDAGEANEEKVKLKKETRKSDTRSADRSSDKQITWSDRAWWVVLAFVPSSWMLAVTARLTTDIAPMPLLWVVPLALYLLTFILVFARRKILPHAWMIRLFPFTIVLLATSVIVTNATSRVPLMIVHLLAFFVATMVCHGELVRRRPPAEQLTQFYLWMSFGGALGGMFNAIVAPLLFPVLLEFPIVIALACLLHPRRDEGTQTQWDLGVLVATTLIVGIMMNVFDVYASLTTVAIVIAAIPLLILFYILRRPKWFAVVAAIVFMWEPFDPGPNKTVMHLARSFYGAHQVTEDVPRDHPETGEPLRRFRRLLHGTTLHGIQDLDPGRTCLPLTYYHPQGPLGEIMEVFTPRDGETQRIAAIGLGTGAMACYGLPERSFRFYEIDPIVQQLAEDPKYFTYLSNCGNGHYEIVIGDGRVKLAGEPDDSFSIIVLDAFSSDAIPTHLLTCDAIEMYIQKLDSDGLLAFHVSNNHLDLAQVLGDNAGHLGYAALVCRDINEEENREYMKEGKAYSTYVVLARNRDDFGELLDRDRWEPLPARSQPQPWTDDYSNILSVMNWPIFHARQ